MYKERQMNKILAAFILFLSAAIRCFAASDSLTITTYYPSPHGAYDEMRANKIVIGDVAGASIIDPADSTLTLNPLNNAPLGSISEGAMYYDRTEHGFKYWDGSGSWKDLGGGGVERVWVNDGNSVAVDAVYEVANPFNTPHIDVQVFWTDVKSEAYLRECRWQQDYYSATQVMTLGALVNIMSDKIFIYTGKTNTYWHFDTDAGRAESSTGGYYQLLIRKD
jgi:hypothetical protein